MHNVTHAGRGVEELFRSVAEACCGAAPGVAQETVSTPRDAAASPSAQYTPFQAAALQSAHGEGTHSTPSPADRGRVRSTATTPSPTPDGVRRDRLQSGTEFVFDADSVMFAHAITRADQRAPTGSTQKQGCRVS